VYSTLLFSPATQTCCSEGEDGLEFFDDVFKATCCPGCHSVDTPEDNRARGLMQEVEGRRSEAKGGEDHSGRNDPVP
jgi:hypothetical protein